MSFSELKKLIDNLVNFGTITETKSADGKALARVKIGERETDFLPIRSFSNSFKKHFIPARVEEQVIVISPFGEANGGFILRSIFNKSSKEPSGSNDHTEVIEYEDGTRFSYDTQAKELKINARDKITIVCNAATVTADTVDITATTSNTGDVTINGKLTVTKLITGQGGLAISGEAGASFDGDVTINGESTVTELITGQGGLAISGGSGASVDGDITTTGKIADSKGDLTGHGHNDSDGGISNPR